MATILDCTVSINGVSIGTCIVDVTQTNDICQGVGGVTITLASSYAGTISPSDLIWVDEYGHRVFTGYVSEFKRETPPAKCTIIGGDVLKRAKDYFLADPVYSSGQTITYWIEYFLDLAGLTSRVVTQTSATVPPDTVFELEYLIEIVKKLCSTEGWVVFADEVGVVYVGDYVSYTAPVASFTEGNNIVSINRQINDDWIRNKIVVWGDADVMATVEDLANPYMNGEVRAAAIFSQRITTSSQALAIASELAIDMAVPYDGKACVVVGDGSYFPQVGDTVFVQDTFTDLNQSCLVYTVDDVMGPDTHVRTLGLDSKCPYYWGWGSGVIPASGIAYIGHKSAGVYRHTIALDSSVLRNTGLTGSALNVHDLKINPHTYGDGVRHLWITTDDGVYKTENDAQLWTKVTLPDPVNTAGDSPAPTVADLEWYSVEVDKVESSVVHVLAGYTSPVDRLWLYTTKDYGVTWSSFGLHFHSAAGGGWASLGGTSVNELVYFQPADLLYLARCSSTNWLYHHVYSYDGAAFVDELDLTALEPGYNCAIAALVVTEQSSLVDSKMWVVANCDQPIALHRKIVVYRTSDGIIWTKVFDTYEGIGIDPAEWESALCVGGAIGADDYIIIAVQEFTYDSTPPFPHYDFVESHILRDYLEVWTIERSESCYYEALSKSPTGSWPPGADIVWLRNSDGETWWRLEYDGGWELKATNAVEWGTDQFSTYFYDGYLYAIDYSDNAVRKCRNGYTWLETDVELPPWYGIPMGLYEGRLVTTTRDTIYIQTTHGIFEEDYSQAGLGLPRRVVEAWDILWLVTTTTGLWSRDTGYPPLRYDLRRSSDYAGQGHQYSLATLPNYPWIVYVAAARVIGGEERIRVLRIHTECYCSVMSHVFGPSLAGYVRVSAPPNNTSDEIVYAFGYGTDGVVEQIVWLFKTAYIPFDITGDGWTAGDKITVLLHNSDELDWVALTSLGATRETMDGGGGDLWSDLTDVVITTDGGDRMDNLILAGKAIAGVPVLKCSEDRAITWDDQGASIDNSAGIASVQIVKEI